MCSYYYINQLSVLCFCITVFLFYLQQFSEDEEDTKRVVRSAKEKRYEELKNIIKNIKNYKKNKDMASLLSSKCGIVLQTFRKAVCSWK